MNDDIAYEDNGGDCEPDQGWAGDGSGTDDLADMNANEVNDYRNEGNEDSQLDSFYEDRDTLTDE